MSIFREHGEGTVYLQASIICQWYNITYGEMLWLCAHMIIRGHFDDRRILMVAGDDVLARYRFPSYSLWN